MTERTPGSLLQPQPDRMRRHRRLLMAVLIFIVPLALGLTVGAALVTYFAADLWFTQFIQRFTHPGFRWLMIAVSWPGNAYHPLLMTLGAAALLLLLRLRVEAVCLLISVGGGSLLSNTVKLVTARPRPVIDLVEVYLPHATKSFPSGHVVGYLALYGFLFYLVFLIMPRSRLRHLLLALLGGLIGLVGLSRIYLGAHWISDVVGGYCFGLIWLTLVIHLYWQLKARRRAPM